MKPSRSIRLAGLVLVLVASACGGCCEVMHLGWARSYGPRSWKEVRRADASVLARATLTPKGRYEANTCKVLCASGDEVEIVACRPVEIRMPELTTRVVSCSYAASPVSAKKSVSREVVEPGATGRNPTPEACALACARGTDEVTHCGLEEDYPPSPPETDHFVACALHKPGGCGSPRLSQRGHDEDHRPETACGAVPDLFADEASAH